MPRPRSAAPAAPTLSLRVGLRRTSPRGSPQRRPLVPCLASRTATCWRQQGGAAVFSLQEPPVRLALALLPSLVLTVTGLARAQTPCFEPSFGTLLGSDDDIVFPAITFATPFSAFSQVFLQAEVSSNGFVWLGANSNPDAGCCSGTGAALAAGAPRICAFWTNLVTDGVAGSGVYHASPPGREVITWANAYEAYDPTIRFTVQLQLAGTGEFTVWFHPSTSLVQAPNTAVCGVSPGTTTDPGSIDFSTAAPYSSNTQATLYEEWATGTFDLTQRAFEFAPNGVGGWLLQDRSTCPFVPASWVTYGPGCPPATGISGASFYEEFTGATLDLTGLEFELTPNGTSGYLVQQTSGSFFAGYTNAVPMQDDQVVDQILPFPFLNPGSVCTTAGFCSNGYVWLDNFNNGAAAAPFVPAFLFDGPRISAAWTDFDMTAGGMTYFDASATEAYFTWIDAPDFSNPALRSTFQIQLFADGRIKLCYGSMAIGANRPVLAGYGAGGALHDPGSIDLTASVPFVSGSGFLPVILQATGAQPVLGQAFPLEVLNLRPSALIGLLALGFTQFNPGLPLAGVGMPNCFLHTSLDATPAFVITGATTPINLLTIPGNLGLLGAQVHAQAAILDPGITPIDLAASNGGTMTFGMY
jgi:hypothetical protein